FTMYRGTSDLPPFNEYSMENRTYRFYKGDVLYPFGYGLSYTTFEYGDLKIVAPKNDAPGTVTATIKNTGKRAGDEITQMYVSGVRRSIRELRGVASVFLKPGETKTVQFPL